MYLVGLFILSFTLYSLEELFPFIINKVNISYRQKGVKNISEQESIIKKKKQRGKSFKVFLSFKNQFIFKGSVSTSGSQNGFLGNKLRNQFNYTIYICSYLSRVYAMD